jgi:hypothetical protein
MWRLRPAICECRAAYAVILSVWGSGRHTGMVLQYLPLLAFPAVVAPWLWQLYRRRQRRPAVARFGSQHGMRYSPAGGIDLPAYDFPLLRKGDDCGCKNVLVGRWQDLPVKAADYWYTTTVTGQRRQGSSDFSFVIADLAATVPYASVQKKSLFTKAGEHLGLHHIDFESEDFNRKFRVTASDKDFAVKLIDASMIRWLLSTGGEFAFEVRGSHLLVFCHLLPATGLARLFGAAKSFIDHVPHVVWAEYGQAANSRDGGTPG